MNGREAATSPVLTAPAKPTSTIGPFVVGSASPAGTATPFLGLIDEIQVWNSTVTADQLAKSGAVTEDGLSLLNRVATWDPRVAAPTDQVADTSLYSQSEVAALSRANLSLANNSGPVHTAKDVTSGLINLDGKTGLWADGAGLLDESGGFTVSTVLTLDPQKMAEDLASQGRARVIGRTNDTWSLWFVKTGVVVEDGITRVTGVWTFDRRTSAGPIVTARTDPDKEWQVTLGQEVRLTAVYNPLQVGREMCVYQNSDELGCSAMSNPTQGLGQLTAAMAEVGPWQWSDFMVGSMRCISLFAGAADANQILQFPGCA